MSECLPGQSTHTSLAEFVDNGATAAKQPTESPTPFVNSFITRELLRTEREVSHDTKTGRPPADPQNAARRQIYGLAVCRRSRAPLIGKREGREPFARPPLPERREAHLDTSPLLAASALTMGVSSTSGSANDSFIRLSEHVE